MTLTTPGCPLGGYIDDAIHDTLWGVPGVPDVDVRIVWAPPWDPDEMMSDWAKEQLRWNRSTRLRYCCSWPWWRCR